MDKLKVYQKIYQLPELIRNFMDVNEISFRENAQKVYLFVQSRN